MTNQLSIFNFRSTEVRTVAIDAEVQRLQFALSDTEALECGTAEKCDQFRAQINSLREALEDSYMTNPCDTNSQQKAFDKAQSALATTGDKHGS